MTGRSLARRRQWFPVLTGRFVALAAGGWVLVVALPLSVPWGLVVVDGALVALLALDRLLTPSPARFAVERVAPVRATVGSGDVVRWTVRNSTGRRRKVSLADGFPPSLGASTRRATLALAPHGAVSAEVAVLPVRRGRSRIEVLTLRVRGPLGLQARHEDRPYPHVVRVHPVLPSRREAELRIARGRSLEVGSRSARAFGGGTEFEQLREYGVDDDYRRIDWAATARTGKPIVRTYRTEQNQNVIVLLDCGRTMAGRVADVPRLEHGMDAALALATVASRLGDRVGLLGFDRSIRTEVPPHHGREQVGRLAEAVFDLQPELVESDYRGAFAHLLGRYRRRALVVLVTDLAPEVVADTMVPAIGLVTRRHALVVAGVGDPEVSRWSAWSPDDATSTYRKVAAVRTLDERRRTVAALRSRGAVVIDAAPGRLGADLADEYLRTKAVGGL